MSVEEDLFEANTNELALKRAMEMLDSPVVLRDLLAKRNEQYQAAIVQLDEANNTIAESSVKVAKWAKFLDADGYMDVSEIAERIKVPYIGPNGKRQMMGLQYFCKLLTYDKILLEKSTGYGLYASCSKAIRENSKVVTNEHNGYIKSSVKFNARALEVLEDKYSTDDRVWHSTTDRDIYFE